MFEQIITLAQMVVTALLAGWIFVGVRDNLLYPDMNRTFTSEVISLKRIRADYPDHHAFIAHRAVTNPKLNAAAFRLVIVFECLAALVLTTGAVLLFTSLFGWSSLEIAKTIALAGSLIFTSIFAGFLIVGNHFAYWYCHEGAQTTHFHLVLWGLGSMIFLTV